MKLDRPTRLAMTLTARLRRNRDAMRKAKRAELGAAYDDLFAAVTETQRGTKSAK